jgi:hypothetical protein
MDTTIKEADVTTNLFAEGCAFIEGEYFPIAEARIPIIDTGFTRSDLTYDVVAVWLKIKAFLPGWTCSAPMCWKTQGKCSSPAQPAA